MLRKYGLPLILVVAVSRGAIAQEETPPQLDRVLDGVAWIGPGVSLPDLRGKTVVLLTYVTWCPKCSVWSPDLFAQVKAAAEDRPIVIVAICTDAPTIPGPVYVSERGLVGRNILHAYDARMDERLGMDGSRLFNAMIIGPEGDVLHEGQASSYYSQDDGSRDFVVARKLRELDNPGEFTIVTADMPEEVRTLLWPMEFGRVVSERDLNRAKRGMSAENRAALEEAVDSFVSGQLTVINELREGEAPQKMAAYAKADLLARSYPRSEAGREARSIVNELNRDSDFKREIAARLAYERLLESSGNESDARQRAQLTGFARRFEGTYFAQQALDLLGRDDSERDSSGADAVSVE